MIKFEFDEEIKQSIEIISGERIESFKKEELIKMVISLRLKFLIAYQKGVNDCHKDYHNDKLIKKDIK